jgi:hypothetical protein
MLVFIDLIAHLIFRLVAENGGPNLLSDSPANKIDIENFRLVLNVSFASEKEAICLEMI